MSKRRSYSRDLLNQVQFSESRGTDLVNDVNRDGINDLIVVPILAAAPMLKPSASLLWIYCFSSTAAKNPTQAASL